MNFVVRKNNAGQRLDTFLVEKSSEFSRSALKKLIENESVLVGGEKTKASYKISEGDKIEIKLTKAPAANKIEPENLPLDIIFENDDAIVINKPAGMLVHPDKNYRAGTLVNALLYYYPPIVKVGEPERPGIVHRLDKDTSGLIICAKNQRAYLDLVAKFKSREITKKYYALVFGRVKDERGIIAYSLSKNKSGTAKMTVAADKPAETRYRVKEYFSNAGQDYTLLEVSPKTGRTHQIRIHLAKIGHPIVGDQLYSYKQHRRECSLKRQFLHAFRLELKLPDGEKKVFETDLAGDLRNFLSKLNNI